MSKNRLDSFVLEPDKLTAWETGYTLHSFTVKRQGSAWLLVIRVNAKKGGRLVTFIQCATIADCYEVWLAALEGNAFKLRWSNDQYA